MVEGKRVAVVVPAYEEALLVAETISAHSGLGYMINHARDFLQTDVIVVGLAVYSLLGLATDAVVRFIEGRALAWRA